MTAETTDTPDIVERLREKADGFAFHRAGLPSTGQLLAEAADTILALRAEEQRLLRQVDELRTRFKQTTRTLPTVEILP